MTFLISHLPLQNFVTDDCNKSRNTADHDNEKDDEAHAAKPVQTIPHNIKNDDNKQTTKLYPDLREMGFRIDSETEDPKTAVNHVKSHKNQNCVLEESTDSKHKQPFNFVRERRDQKQRSKHSAYAHGNGNANNSNDGPRQPRNRHQYTANLHRNDARPRTSQSQSRDQHPAKSQGNNNRLRAGEEQPWYYKTTYYNSHAAQPFLEKNEASNQKT